MPNDLAESITPRDRRIIGLYSDDGLSCDQIARRIGLHKTTISKIISRYERIRPYGSQKRKPRQDLERRNKRIERLYRKGMPAEKIGLRLGLGQSTILRVLVARGVPRRTRDTWQSARPGPNFYRNRAFAKRIARLVGTGPGTSARALAKMFGISALALGRHLKAIGVDTHQAQGMGLARLTLKQATAIKRLLARGKLNHTEIGRKYGVADGTIAAIASGITWKHAPWPRDREPSGGSGDSTVNRGRKPPVRNNIRPTRRSKRT